MDLLALAAAAFAIVATLIHVLSVLITATRFKRPTKTHSPSLVIVS